MKKLLVLLCALTLMTVSPASAQTDYTACCGATPVLTVHYDGGQFHLDTESYLGSSRGGHTWLGLFYNDSCSIDLSADRYADLPAGCSLEQMSDYLCQAMRPDQCAVLETWREGSVPFVIFSLNGPSGSSYLAATLSQGYVVHFEIFCPRGGVNADTLNTLKGLLRSVTF